MSVRTRIRASAFIATLFATAHILTACPHHTPAIYDAPVSTWEDR